MHKATFAGSRGTPLAVQSPPKLVQPAADLPPPIDGSTDQTTARIHRSPFLSCISLFFSPEIEIFTKSKKILSNRWLFQIRYIIFPCFEDFTFVEFVHFRFTIDSARGETERTATIEARVSAETPLPWKLCFLRLGWHEITGSRENAALLYGWEVGS